MWHGGGGACFGAFQSCFPGSFLSAQSENDGLAPVAVEGGAMFLSDGDENSRRRVGTIVAMAVPG